MVSHKWIFSVCSLDNICEILLLIKRRLTFFVGSALAWCHIGVQHSGHLFVYSVIRPLVNINPIVHPRSQVNQHLPSGPVHPYQLDKSIFNFRGVWCTFFIFMVFRIDIPISKQWTLIRRHILWHLIWVCTIFLCPKYGMLGLNELITCEPRHEKTCFAICKQQRRRSACAATQSDQRLCCSLTR